MYTFEQIDEMLRKELYVSSTDITTAIFLALNMGKPLLVEGEAGCGKTEIAKVLSEALRTDLIRLQCYEGLDVNTSVYEWDYLRQLLKIRIEEGKSEQDIESKVYDEKYLLKRPLLQAVLHDSPKPPVLLIDEVDRADEEFEGFLLEFLAEFQVTIPEIGTIKSKQRPITILTSNRTRELGDGIRRRCLYLYIDYPTIEKESAILELKVPALKAKLAKELAGFMHEIRNTENLIKRPGVAETLDWAQALILLNRDDLDARTAESTLSCILKNREDIEKINTEELETILAKVKK